MADVVDDPNRAVASRERPPPAPPPPRWYELPTLTRVGWLHINAGVALVTFLCPALSNYALFRLALGLAVSLGSVGPLYGLILDWPFKGRRPTVSGCAGALLAVAGVVILCLWGT
jgi:drug/metabolite transporter (DMT)-like permease